MKPLYSILFRYHEKLHACDWVTWKDRRMWTMSHMDGARWMMHLDSSGAPIFNIMGQSEVLQHFGIVSLRHELPISRLWVMSPMMLYQLRQIFELERHLKPLTRIMSQGTEDLVRPWDVM